MYPPLFCEVIEDAGDVFARVRKRLREWKSGVEKKGVSCDGFASFWKILEVAGNKGLREFLRQPRLWWDAGRLADSDVRNATRVYIRVT